MKFEKFESALRDLKKGKMIILTDHPDRENEGDIIFAAENVTPDKINFMLQHCSGIICLVMARSQIKQLQLPLMIPQEENTSTNHTAFTVSIEARKGITTGVSALDRTRTIQAATSLNAKPEDLVRPGHIFPLYAKDGGVLERPGHTEGSIDLMKLARLRPAAVICELMNPNGTMMRGEELKKFARKNKLSMLSIQDILDYRLNHEPESLIADTTSSILPLLDNQLFDITIIKEKYSLKEHIVLSKPSPKTPKNSRELPLVRIHSTCMTGDVFGSLRCECHAQLQYSLDKISREGGILIYLNQEGRNIGLLNKIKAYALQDKGLDTVEANKKLDLSVDARNYAVAAHILKNKNLSNIRLLTNNPDKINNLKKYGISTIVREPLPLFINRYNKKYVKTKQNKLGHYNDHQSG